MPQSDPGNVDGYKPAQKNNHAYAHARERRSKPPKKGSAPVSKANISNKQTLTPLDPMHVKKGKEVDNQNVKAGISLVDKEERKRFEQVCLDIMRRKQEEMWNQFKQGNFCDDFLGAVGVFNHNKELEFLKRSSDKFKEGQGLDLISNGQLVNEGNVRMDTVEAGMAVDDPRGSTSGVRDPKEN
ncbi:hypothetical protein RIF29_13180 [Crotalaria pallida]|uniref:Uncharacterized protein n=1 Tax=Crotalaria pallida TaxID=3830 RepID=A0AAN9P2T8_CROPI